jgi:protein SCO1
MLRRRLLMIVSLLSVALGVGAAETRELRSGVFKPPRSAPDFSLLGSDGAPLTLSRYHGNKVIALGFGFTHCTDVCPLTLANLVQVRKQLGAVGDKFQVVYVTVDPERDNAERLREYVTAFDPTFIGATGTAEQLEAVRKIYGIIATKEIKKGAPLSSYTVHHSSFIYLIDLDGNLRAMVPFKTPIEDVAHDVNVLLSEHENRVASRGAGR